MKAMSVLGNVLPVFLLSGIMHMNFYFHGTEVRLVFGGEILATLLFIYGLTLKRWSLDKDSVVIFLMCFLPVMLSSFVQIFYIRDVIVVKTLIHRFLFIIASYVIVKMISFERFTLYLRYWGLLNLIVMLIVIAFGTIEILDANIQSYGRVAMSYMGVAFPFAIASFEGEMLRCGGLFGHPNGFGLLSAIGFVGIFNSRVSYKSKLFWLIVFIISFLINESRASVLFVGIYFILYLLFTKKMTVKNILMIGLITILISVIFLFLMYLREGTGLDFTSGRTDLLAGMYQKFDDEQELVQLFGVGFGNVANYVISKFAEFVPFDGSYLYTLIELGYIGSVVFFSALITAICYACKKTSIKHGVWIPFWVAFFIHSILESDFVADKYMYVVIFLFYMVAYRYAEIKNR